MDRLQRKHIETHLRVRYPEISGVMFHTNGDGLTIHTGPAWATINEYPDHPGYWTLDWRHGVVLDTASAISAAVDRVTEIGGDPIARARNASRLITAIREVGSWIWETLHIVNATSADPLNVHHARGLLQMSSHVARLRINQAGLELHDSQGPRYEVDFRYEPRLFIHAGGPDDQTNETVQDRLTWPQILWVAQRYDTTTLFRLNQSLLNHGTALP